MQTSTADTLTPLQKNAVTVAGRADARPTLVFVHGFGTDQTAWTAVAAGFGDCRVVLLDNVGAGRSPPDAFVQHRYLGLDRYAADVGAVCDALGTGPVVMIGHSAGGMIAALLAADRPELVERLVLIGTSPRYRNAADYHGGFTEDDVRDVYRAMAANYSEWADHFARLMVATPDRPQIARDFAACLKNIPSERALTVLCSIFQSDHRDALPRIACPTLVVQTRDDAIVPPEVVDYLKGALRDCRVAKLDVAGHVPHITEPARVIDSIADFVRGAGAPAA